jgi:hypothetical protein
MGRDDRRGTVFLAIVAAVLVPPGYLSYSVLVRWLQGNPTAVRALSSPPMLLSILLLAWVGVLAVGLRVTRLRVSLGVVLVGFLAWPWLYISVPVGGGGPLAIPFVVALLVTAGEGTVRYQDRLEAGYRQYAGRHALAVGLGHAAVGLGLQWYSRTGYPDRFFSPIAVGISALALVGLGALPVVLWSRDRLVLPGVVVGGWLGWGLLRTWQLRASLPRGAFSGIAWVSTAPAPDYAVKWTVPLLAVVVGVAVELGGRRLREYTVGGTTAN